MKYAKVCPCKSIKYGKYRSMDSIPVHSPTRPPGASLDHENRAKGVPEECGWAPGFTRGNIFFLKVGLVIAGGTPPPKYTHRKVYPWKSMPIEKYGHRKAWPWKSIPIQMYGHTHGLQELTPAYGVFSSLSINQ